MSTEKIDYPSTAEIEIQVCYIIKNGFTGEKNLLTEDAFHI